MSMVDVHAPTRLVWMISGSRLSSYAPGPGHTWTLGAPRGLRIEICRSVFRLTFNRPAIRGCLLSCACVQCANASTTEYCDLPGQRFLLSTTGQSLAVLAQLQVNKVSATESLQFDYALCMLVPLQSSGIIDSEVVQVDSCPRLFAARAGTGLGHLKIA
eukprot:1435077-Pleurochrysis_carterae.AAC.1